MIITWMLTMSVFTALLAVAALAAERLARAFGREGRWGWVAAMVIGSAWPIAAPIISRVSPAPSASVTLLPGIRVMSDARQALEDSPIVSAPLLASVVLIVWLVATALLALRLLRAMMLLRRVRASSAVHVVDETRVLVSDAIGPAVIGLRRREVVLSRDVLDLDAHMRRLVLMHEREHCAARDPWLLLGAAIAVTLVPWNLPLRWIARRLHLSLELDCDARVLAAGAEMQSYGRLLLWTAQRPRGLALAPMLAASPSHLERRIIAMRDRLRRPRPSQIAIAATLLIVALIGACSAGTSDSPLTAKGSASATKDLADIASSVTSSTSAPARVDGPYFEFQVEKQVQQLRTPQGVLRYPDELRTANIEGEVLAQFVVDTNGRYETGSFKALKSSHEKFTAAVTSALPNMRFNPAEIGGRKVRQLVQQPFTFSLQRN